jgi:hypothetical protein
VDYRVYSLTINRHGRAKVLTQSEIQLIFSHGLEIAIAKAQTPYHDYELKSPNPFLVLRRPGDYA